MIHISHAGGCGQYSWPRAAIITSARLASTLRTMQFTSDFQEKDIVFGGDKKLAKIIDEIEVLFPLNKASRAVRMSDRPHRRRHRAVSKAKTKEYAGKTIVPVRCEGFRGVSQSLAIISPMTRSAIGCSTRWRANRPASSQRLTTSRSSATTTSAATPGLRAFYWKRWACASSRSVGRRHDRGTRSHASRQAQCSSLLSLDELHLAHMEENTHAVVEYNFFGPPRSRVAAQDRQSLRRDDQGNAEKVIAKYQALCDAVIANIARVSRANVMLYVGACVRAMSSAPMKTSAWKSSDRLRVWPQRRLSAHDSLCEDGTLIYDDVTGYEFEKFVERSSRSRCSGIKEKYVFQKMGVPFRQMHSWIIRPYHGYDGFAIFAPTWTWRSTRRLENDKALGPLD